VGGPARALSRPVVHTRRAHQALQNLCTPLIDAAITCIRTGACPPVSARPSLRDSEVINAYHTPPKAVSSPHTPCAEVYVVGGSSRPFAILNCNNDGSARATITCIRTGACPPVSARPSLRDSEVINAYHTPPKAVSSPHTPCAAASLRVTTSTNRCAHA
jgi:hypothetical protein